MKKVTRLKMNVVRDGIVITAYGQTARGTKFSQGQVKVFTEKGAKRPSTVAIAEAIDMLRSRKE